MLDIDDYSAATRLLYADYIGEDEDVWSCSPPLHQTVPGIADNGADFAKKASTPLEERFYARNGNPTNARFAKVISNLEGGEETLVMGSGTGATTTALLTFLKAGDHVIAQKNHYMGTAKMVSQVLPHYGIDHTLVDQRSVAAFEQAIRPNTKLILLETPVNPLLYITDIKAVCAIARAHNILTFCDNTFTPINQKPLAMGVDIVMHSTTKYISGHHDQLGGSLTASRDICEQLWDMSMNIGATPAPFNSWLALRGIRTLDLRIRQQSASVQAMAEFLEHHPAVRQVFYPGLKSHPQHALAKRQMAGFGGLFTFDLVGGYAAGQRFISRLKLTQNAPSLGGVHTMVAQPAVMFGGNLNDELVQEQGITPGMIRIAAGIENTDDLLWDIEQALK